MTNTITTNSIVLKAAMAMLLADTPSMRIANKSVSSIYPQQVGQDVQVKRPQRLQGRRDTLTYTAKDYKQETLTMTASKVAGCDLDFSYNDLLFKINPANFTKENLQDVNQVIAPAVTVISSIIEEEIWTKAQSRVNMTIGTPGTAINDPNVINQARAKVREHGYQANVGVLDINESVSLAGSVDNFYNSNMNSQALNNGFIRNLHKVDLYESTGVVQVANGSFATSGTIQVNTTATEGATTLALKGFTASATGILKVGNVFTIPGIYAVKPTTQEAISGQLYEFLITDTSLDADGSGNVTVTLANPLQATGAYANVSALPAENDTLTFKGSASTSYRQSFVGDSRGMMYAAIKPKISGAFAQQEVYTDPRTGLSLMITCQGDATDLSTIWRIDHFYGVQFESDSFVRVYGG